MPHHSERNAMRALPALLLTALLLTALLLTALLPGRAAHAQGGPTEPPDVFLPIVTRFGATATALSPNGTVAVTVRLADPAVNSGPLRYDVVYDGMTVVTTSALGLAADGLLTATSRYEWVGATQRRVNQSYATPLAERNPIPNRYTELTVALRAVGAEPAFALRVVVRVFDEGVALRYVLPQQAGHAHVTLRGEQTQFRFTGNHTAYQQVTSEGEYQRTTLGALASQVETPLTMEHTRGFVLSLAEAAVDNYPRAALRRDSATTLSVVFPGMRPTDFIDAPLPFATPWRVLMLAPDYATLLEQNYLLYNLADPSRLEPDLEWGHPGTAMRVANLSDAGMEAVIDFAADHGIDYVELDAGWYVPGYDQEFNPAADPEAPIAAFQGRLPALIQEANSKGLGVVLYVNYNSLKPNVDAIMERYRDWGVKGLKFGFVRAYTQSEINFVHYAVQLAAKNGMFVNIHDDYRPSGLSRTLPNLVTQEGVRGAEHTPGAAHETLLPFTRFLIGAADYTIPYYNEAAVGNSTRAHQLALSVVFFSPLKFVLWYDSPGDYKGEPEIDFFGQVPTTWDETVVLHAAPGEAVALARRKGSTWYLGAITNGSARMLELPLDFLAAGTTYRAQIYKDVTARQVDIETQEVTSTSVLTAAMLSGGGYAVHLEPQQ